MMSKPCVTESLFGLNEGMKSVNERANVSFAGSLGSWLGISLTELCDLENSVLNLLPKQLPPVQHRHVGSAEIIQSRKDKHTLEK